MINGMITVRSQSTRLPKKCFLPFGDGNVLEHIIRRAKHFNINVEDILVIEDSLAGIEGAKKAGVKVWHFIGASHLQSWDKNYNYKSKMTLVVK